MRVCPARMMNPEMLSSEKMAESERRVSSCSIARCNFVLRLRRENARGHRSYPPTAHRRRVRGHIASGTRSGQPIPALLRSAFDSVASSPVNQAAQQLERRPLSGGSTPW